MAEIRLKWIANNSLRTVTSNTPVASTPVALFPTSNKHT